MNSGKGGDSDPTGQRRGSSCRRLLHKAGAGTLATVAGCTGGGSDGGP